MFAVVSWWISVITFKYSSTLKSHSFLPLCIIAGSLHPEILTHSGLLGGNLLSCPLRALRLYSDSLCKSRRIKASTKWINANVYVRADSGLLQTHAESSPCKWVTLELLLSWRLHHDTGRGKRKKEKKKKRHAISSKLGWKRRKCTPTLRRSKAFLFSTLFLCFTRSFSLFRNVF